MFSVHVQACQSTTKAEDKYMRNNIKSENVLLVCIGVEIEGGKLYAIDFEASKSKQ